jgi:hypothetical protein
MIFEVKQKGEYSDQVGSTRLIVTTIDNAISALCVMWGQELIYAAMSINGALAKTSPF